MGIAFRRYGLRLVLAIACAALPGTAPAERPTTATFETRIADAKAAMLRDPQTALRQANAAETAAAAIEPARRKVALATAQWLQGEAYVRMNNPIQAGPRIDRALALVHDAGPPTKLNGDLLLSRGGLKTATADVAAALASYQQAHHIFHQIGDTRSEAIAIVSIGLLYQEAADYQSALKYYSQSLDVYEGDPQLLLSIYNNRGVCYQELKRLDQAQAEFRKALDIARSLDSPVLEALTLRNIARGQLLAGKLDAADRSIALGLSKVGGGQAASVRNGFLVLSAGSAMMRGHPEVASGLIDRFFATVDPDTSTLALREGHQTAYEIDKALGRQGDALRHLEALKQLDDKTSTLAASANTALAAARFDFASQELNIEKLKRAQLQRNIEVARQRADTQQHIFIGLAVVTAAIVGMLAFGLVTIRRSRNEVRAANVDLAETNGALGKALAAKTEFLATTSHEIRTPLNGILGMTQVILADATLGAVLRDRIEVVHGAGVTMRALVDDILDVAKMESGNLTVEHAPFDLRATLREVSRLWEEQARGKGLTFALEVDHCPAWIEGDAARLRQIVFNLLSNALKFTATGGVTISAEQGGTPERPLLTLAVRDTGIGIAADKRDLIFESFRQADAGTTRQFGGTGLGLAICRNLAHAMGGTVTVESVPDEGSTFTVALPLHMAAPPASAPDVVRAAASALLILDRNPIGRAMLRAVLEPRAGSVVFATTPGEAADKIAGGGIARVLVDDATIKAEPELDAALALLAATPVPVALLWPSPSDADRARFRAAGVDLVIAKPIAGPALAAAVFDECDALSQHTYLVTQAA